MFSKAVVFLCAVAIVAAQIKGNQPTHESAARPGSKSLAQCRKYGASVSQNVPGFKKRIDTCAMYPVTDILNGIFARDKEFPYMAAIGYDVANRKRVYNVSGGSLISERYVLTAAHVLVVRNFGPAKTVRLGVLNIKKINKCASVEYDVVQRIRHPDYHPSSLYHDIGLLKLHKDVQFTSRIRPTCLNTLKIFDRAHSLVATGWGRVGFLNKSSDDLLKVELDGIEHAECSKWYSRKMRKLAHGIDEELQLCAGSRTGLKKDTCRGDSGGPLTIHNKQVYCMYDLVGVTSLGFACGLTTGPAVYTRVSHYVPWIESVVWP